MFLIVICILIILISVIVIKSSARKKEMQRQYWEKERMERERREEERKAQEAREEYAKRKKREAEETQKEITALFDELCRTDLCSGEYITQDKKFGRLLEIKHSENADLYVIWNNAYKKYIDTERKNIFNCICDFELINVSVIVVFLKHLKFIEETDRYDSIISELDEFSHRWNLGGFHIFPFFFEQEDNEYGNHEFLIPFKELETEDLETGLERTEMHLAELKSITESSDVLPMCIKLSECVNEEDLVLSVRALWFYAQKKPFDVSLFERACNVFRFYTDSDECECIEVMLARIYNWKSIGGNNVVMDYQKDILDWIENLTFKLSDRGVLTERISMNFRNFTSALAWMELYDLELIVLKKLIELKVQLWADAQDRLKFLSSGGTANIKIYEPDESNFSFDNSAVEWEDNELSVFFRKLKMKNITLKYSLVFKNWTKAYPLQSGQKYDADALYREFQSMAEDYDGEITLSREKASALNMANVNYPDAMIFHFTSERNRCTSILFYAEKFGKNLNITILTLFTPEENIPIEMLEQYAGSIKNNMYADSFQEAILESIDVVLKVRASFYDNLSGEPNELNDAISDFFD